MDVENDENDMGELHSFRNVATIGTRVGMGSEVSEF